MAPPLGKDNVKKNWGPLESTGSAALGGDKKEKLYWSTCGAPDGFKKLSRSMRIPNMCLVLKLDNGKVVSIADEQTESQNHPVPY